MAILDVQDIHTYYGDAMCCRACRSSSNRAHPRPARPQRRRQDNFGQLDRRFNPPRRGKIVFKGNDITRSASFETVRSGMGLVPQGRRVFRP